MTGTYCKNPSLDHADTPWKELLPVHKLSPHKQMYYGAEDIIDIGPITHFRVVIAPDGGISRIRMYGNKEVK